VPKTATDEPPKRAPVDNHVQTALLAIWRDTLGVSQVDVNDSFFDLGGSSFLGLMLIDRVNQLMATRLPLLAMFQAPTVARMLALLQSGFGRLPGTRLIPIQRDGQRPPMVMVHGGNWIASILSAELGPEQPLYILDSHWDHGDIGLDASIEQIAEEGIADMRDLQQGRPWRIGGYSMGALIAWEMACQLQAAGEQVELLMLLDPPVNAPLFAAIDQQALQAEPAIDAHLSPPPEKPSSAMAGSRWQRLLQRSRGRPTNQRITWLARALGETAVVELRQATHRLDQRIGTPLRLMVAHQHHRHGRPVPLSLRLMYVTEAYRLAAAHYRPRGWRGSAVILAGQGYPHDCPWQRLSTEPNRLQRFDGRHEDFTRSPELIQRWARELARQFPD